MTRDVRDVTHRKRGLRFEKSVSRVESCFGRRRLTFACSPWPCVGCARGLGQIEKSGVSLFLCRKTFKLKGNKKFRTWTKKSSSVFRVSGFLCSMYIYYEHSMYVSHIRIMGMLQIDEIIKLCKNTLFDKKRREFLVFDRKYVKPYYRAHILSFRKDYLKVRHNVTIISIGNGIGNSR